MRVEQTRVREEGKVKRKKIAEKKERKACRPQNRTERGMLLSVRLELQSANW